LDQLGQVPLPPYIHRTGLEQSAQDFERYQTVYATDPGSVAAPTAGLHFTHEQLDRLNRAGVKTCFVTLHVGLGTFAPVKATHAEDHRMHEERFAIGSESVQAIRDARREGHRVVAVGTSSLRAVESATSGEGILNPVSAGRTRLFVRPPHSFRAVNVLLTNFHLPRSTLLMLVSAFAAPGETGGRDLILSAYSEAVRGRYRFFSYGDAMLIL
jgi:S-adenosylmethionine:tRNA ribosyltransferase-isomerase